MAWNTKPSPTQTSASIGTSDVKHVFAFNPDEVKWNISNNTVSRDTIGGRVVQILSSRVEQMTVTGRAGSREELQRFAKNMKLIMDQQIRSQAPVFFKVPSKKWNFSVYVQNVSSLGWDYSATSYPYELTLLIQEDLTGLTTKAIQKNTLQRLAEGIGYVKDFHGGSSTDALATSEAYLNTMGYLRSGGGSNVTLAGTPLPGEEAPPASGPSAVPNPGGGTDKPAGVQTYYGRTDLFPPGIANLKWEGANLREAVSNMLTQYAGRNTYFADLDVRRALCVIQYESGWIVNDVGYNGDGSRDYGLFQLNDYSHQEKVWWPSAVTTLFNPEYNTRAALVIWTQWCDGGRRTGWEPWHAYANHCTGIT